MKKFFGGLLIVGTLALFTLPGFAKCMRGNNWKKNGHDFSVCIHGDSWSVRKQGKKVCEKVKGSSCDMPTIFSSSCNGHCYDKDGKEHHSMSGF